MRHVCGTGVNPIVNIYKGETYAAKRKAYFEFAPPKFAILERQLAASGGPFALGSTPYYCDLAIYHVLDNTLTLEPTALDEYPADPRTQCTAHTVHTFPRCTATLCAVCGTGTRSKQKQ